MDDSSHELVPQKNSAMPAVHVNRPMLHPNIYRKRILHIEGHPSPGEWVAVYHQQSDVQDRSPEGSKRNDAGPYRSDRASQPSHFAYGIYNPRSEVAVRMYAWWGQWPDEAFWDRIVDAAVSLRTDVLKLDETTNAYRVIHGEADGLPGLVVDRYADCLSAEVFSLGMYQRCMPLLEKLAQRLGTKHWLIQECPQFLSQEGLSVPTKKSEGLPPAVTITENDVKYKIHFGTGHKTGFFCDQRDNRHRLAQFSQGKSVLDLCCYTGGFSVQAAKAGQATEVTGVDLDEEPLAMAKKNADMNQTRVRFVQSDAFAFMRDMLRIGRQYDIVVLDPPKLIRSRNELEEGSKKHFDLNKLAIQLVKPGGILLTCSCAGLLDEASFHSIVRSAAKATGFDEEGKPNPPRTLQILHTPGAAPDHPVVAHCPETGYLKSIWARVL
jgi:23S rRNA (cytosine1962-C5)-methyltransferase